MNSYWNLYRYVEDDVGYWLLKSGADSFDGCPAGVVQVENAVYRVPTA